MFVFYSCVDSQTVMFVYYSYVQSKTAMFFYYSCVESESSFPHLHETLIKKQSMMIGKGITIEKDKQTIGTTLGSFSTS